MFQSEMYQKYMYSLMTLQYSYCTQMAIYSNTQFISYLWILQMAYWWYTSVVIRVLLRTELTLKIEEKALKPLQHVVKVLCLATVQYFINQQIG